MISIKKLKEKKGSTLATTLLAMIILGMSAGALTHSYGNISNTQSSQSEDANLRNILDDIFNQIKSDNYFELVKKYGDINYTDGTDDTGSGSSGDSSGDTSSANNTSHGKKRITDFSNDYDIETEVIQSGKCNADKTVCDFTKVIVKIYDKNGNYITETEVNRTYTHDYEAPVIYTNSGEVKIPEDAYGIRYIVKGANGQKGNDCSFKEPVVSTPYGDRGMVSGDNERHKCTPISTNGFYQTYGRTGFRQFLSHAGAAPVYRYLSQIYVGKRSGNIKLDFGLGGYHDRVVIYYGKADPNFVDSIGSFVYDRTSDAYHLISDETMKTTLNILYHTEAGMDGSSTGLSGMNGFSCQPWSVMPCKSWAQISRESNGDYGWVDANGDYVHLEGTWYATGDHSRTVYREYRPGDDEYIWVSVDAPAGYSNWWLDVSCPDGEWYQSDENDYQEFEKNNQQVHGDNTCVDGVCTKKGKKGGTGGVVSGYVHNIEGTLNLTVAKGQNGYENGGNGTGNREVCLLNNNYGEGGYGGGSSAIYNNHDNLVAIAAGGGGGAGGYSVLAKDNSTEGGDADRWATIKNWNYSYGDKPNLVDSGGGGAGYYGGLAAQMGSNILGKENSGGYGGSNYAIKENSCNLNDDYGTCSTTNGVFEAMRDALNPEMKSQMVNNDSYVILQMARNNYSTL